MTRNRSLSILIVVAMVAALFALPTVARAQSDPAIQTPPRGPDDRPDLQGGMELRVGDALATTSTAGRQGVLHRGGGCGVGGAGRRSEPLGCPPPKGSVGAYNQFW